MRKPNPAPQAILSAGLSRDLRLESASVSLGASSPSMNALISRNVTRSSFHKFIDGDAEEVA